MSPNAPRGPRTHFTPYMGPKYDVLKYHQKLTNSAILKRNYINWVQSRPRLHSTKFHYVTTCFSHTRTLQFLFKKTAKEAATVSAVARDHQFQAVAMVFSEDFDHDDGGGRHTIILNTLFEIFSFCPKISTLISRENCRFFLGEKLVKMLWF